ncbi:beta-glucosidase [Murimonas intestini]|uniref:Beta-glucosidase n=1 Tax=Murimonas intestini TaxID=1337051 RepID=A0AB73T304_9FIRM|nr:glycoside hydrolase family 3 N-terminal domain-containing protein [Murimonas intestini]MCR1841492.1 glycoside hydrolase family 3 C-terminal domain-containing protein [Murimonas intestini]MCR1866998.1 glycoside hydrolase family 3 C-terminal domain-containing protein [Murimonas intestini]MCR1884021.1 glycoside hydrolase family 3 C-terminal domain-containing protein [Murimonas intestini]
MRLADKSSIETIINEMSLEEKLTLLTGESEFKGPALEKYGIPSVYYLDGGTGANYMQMVLDAYGRLKNITDGGEAIFGNIFAPVPTIIDCLLNPEKEKDVKNPQLLEDIAEMRKMMEEYIPGGELPGCFPPGVVFGATWDPENIYESGRALGKEAHYFNIDVLLGTPNVNIHRDPLGGRMFEGYSEDPCLVSKLAPAFVKGIQDEGIIANVKHFAANNQETDRRTVNEHIPERALQEIYFPGFKACVQEGGCKTVMSAYNAINGEYCALNKWLLTDVLKKEWDFDGFVVSDWTAAYDQVKAWNAGNDMDMPGPRSIKGVLEAAERGELDEEKVNDSVRRYLNIILEMPVMKGRRYNHIDRAGSARAAYNSIKEAIVLLKNEGGTLPLDREKGVCFFGEKSRQFLESGSGSANVVTSESTSLYETMVQKLGCDRVSFEEITDNTDTVVITVGIVGQEGFDRAEMNVTASDRIMLKRALGEAKAKNKKTVVILNVCGPVDVSDYVDDVDAMLCIFIPGMEGGHAVADALLGEFSPSGKLPVTFPKHYRDVPSCSNFPGRNKEVWYGEGIFVGYRYYDYRGIEPRYPFGYGLSYTTFEIEGAKTDKNILNKDRDDDKITVTVNVKNTGNMTGKEVVQLYIGEKNPALVKPPKELKDFRKVEVAPGEVRQVVFVVTAAELASYDDAAGKWVVQPDEYTLYIGTSSRDIAAELKIQAEGWNAFGISADTPLGVIAATPGALDKMLEFIPDGILTREMVELQVLFQDTDSLEGYWKAAVESLLDLPEEEKKKLYESLLNAMNAFVV